MKTVEDYLRLPYHIVLVQDEDDEGNTGYVAEVRELPGCLSQGGTPSEAYENVRDAMYGWIKVALEDGKPIPNPAEEPEFSGRILVRCPKTLHASLSQAADHEGVSLNQFVVSALSSAVAWRLPGSNAHPRLSVENLDVHLQRQCDTLDRELRAWIEELTRRVYLGLPSIRSTATSSGSSSAADALRSLFSKEEELTRSETDVMPFIRAAGL